MYNKLYRSTVLFVASFFAVLFLLPGQSNAQWSNNPNLNLKICDTTGEQSLSKIASTSDGGCYVSWFDNRSGAYCVYLQRLNSLGEKQWPENGLLISSNPQETYLVDYDLIADQNNNAVLVFVDAREGTTFTPFAYKISPTGQFLWGPNGVGLSTTPTAFQADPKVVETDDGGFVFAWIYAEGMYSVAMQKLSAAGTKLWGINPVYYRNMYTRKMNYPRMVKSDNNSVIVVHTSYTGNFPALTVHLYAQKFNGSGSVVWDSNGVAVQNLGTIASFSKPYVISDGMNGAVVSWHDDRDNNVLANAFVQRITPTGALVYANNGIELAVNNTRHHFSPKVAIAPLTQDIYGFWEERNSAQTDIALWGQRITASGARMWGEAGKAFIPSTTNSLFGPYPLAFDSLVYFTYMDGNAGGNQDRIITWLVNPAGENIWAAPLLVSSATNQKMHPVTALDNSNGFRMSWSDDRDGASGIYAQNVNYNGTLGNATSPNIVNLNLTEGWNLVAVPIAASSMLPAALFPQANSSAYSFNNGYIVADTIKNGKGYWIRYPQPATVSISGNIISANTIPVQSGWNMIGVYSQSVPIGAITTTPAGITNSQYFSFNNGYVAATGSLNSGTGYWIRATQAGVINLPSGTGKDINNALLPVTNLPRVTITDAAGRSSTLYLLDKYSIPSAYDLPPLPPAGVFDVRFSSQRIAEYVHTSTKEITVSGAVYPITITVEGASITVVDKATHGKYLNKNISDNGNVQIFESSINSIEITAEQNPVAFELFQNYPNPFNPATTIGFSLPEKSEVNVQVFNQLGETVALLIHQEMEAGTHNVHWDATNIVSGVYFCELKTAKYKSVKKLLLMK
ncbi:MAG: T9SS type A sorting domain-containing protein [Ignavibacteriales bacterium]|nr:T9SS type A sorting domain-containing protein [Ignavibacteriales bacterium]